MGTPAAIASRPTRGLGLELPNRRRHQARIAADALDLLDDELLDLAVEFLIRGYSHPALFNDTAITRGLMGLGMPEAHARNYVHSSCVEITACG